MNLKNHFGFSVLDNHDNERVSGKTPPLPHSRKNFMVLIALGFFYLQNLYRRPPKPKSTLPACMYCHGYAHVSTADESTELGGNGICICRRIQTFLGVWTIA